MRESLLTNAKMTSVGDVTRQSYTVVWARTDKLQLDADHATLDRVLVRYLDEDLLAKGESRAVARLVLFGTIYCSGIPRHPHITSSCRRALREVVRDEPGVSKRPPYCWKRQ